MQLREENVHPGDGRMKAKQTDLQLCLTIPTRALSTPTSHPSPPPSTPHPHGHSFHCQSLLCLYICSFDCEATGQQQHPRVEVSWQALLLHWVCLIFFFIFSFSPLSLKPPWLLQALRTYATECLHLLVATNKFFSFSFLVDLPEPTPMRAVATLPSTFDNLEILQFIGRPDNCRCHLENQLIKNLNFHSTWLSAWSCTAPQVESLTHGMTAFSIFFSLLCINTYFSASEEWD